MAELFKPEVRDVGGTNVTAYTPPSMDYSGFISNVGQIFRGSLEEKEVKGPTEAERKMEALRTVSANMMKIDQIEDPTRKAVAFKTLQQNAYREYPVYVDDLNKFFGEVSGDIYPATGTSLEDINRTNRLKWAQETPEGKLAASEAMMTAPGDIETQQIMIDSAYYQQQKFEADMASVKRESEGRKDLFELKARPMIQGKADEEYQKIFKENNIQALLQSGETPSLALIDAVKAQRSFVLGAITSEINKNGLDPTTIKPETFMTQFDALIGMLEANSTIVDREFKNRENTNWAKTFTNSSFMIKQWAAGKVDPATFNWWLVNGGGEEEFMKITQSGVGVAAQNGTSPLSMSPSMSTGGPTDSASEVASRYEGSFSREALITTFNSKPAWKPVIEDGLKTIQNYKLEGESPEFMEASHRALTSMYMVSLPEFDTGLESMKPTNIKKLLGDKTFFIAENMSKSMPDKGMGLYNVMNTYSINAANVLVNNFKVQMDAIKYTDNVPFMIETDEFGNLELVVNPLAARLDTNLKKAMGSYKYSTRSRGGRATETLAVEQAPTETDPKKILSNYVSLLQGSNQRQILDIVESMNVLARTSRKIPDSVKQGMDALTVIRQGFKTGVR
jgi:hypothetical protein